jgi:hypothetical protein
VSNLKTNDIGWAHNIIQDHNADGFDSVDSEDFDPGFGCVPIQKQRKPPPLPPFQPASEEEKKRLYYYFMTEAEKAYQDDLYLKKFCL